MGKTTPEITQSTLCIVQASIEDAPDFARILTEAGQFKQDREGYVSWDVPYPLERAQKHIKAGRSYLGYLGCKAVAAVRLYTSDEIIWGPEPDGSALYLHGLAVADEARGLGLGQHILDWASRETARYGREFLRLDCTAHNTDLRAYYEDQGFILAGLTDFSGIGDNGYDSARYERPVTG